MSFVRNWIATLEKVPPTDQFGTNFNKTMIFIKKIPQWIEKVDITTHNIYLTAHSLYYIEVIGMQVKVSH